MSNRAESDRTTLVGADAVTEQPRAVAEAPAPDLEDPSLYFNRELSWLDFNDRVLQLAEDPTVPLLERVMFCAIYQDNLDEFFMVRVSNLHEQIEAARDARGADGMSPSEVIETIHDRVSGLRGRLADCFERDLRPALAEHGVRLISVASANAAERAQLGELFENQIFPTLTPLVIGHGRPFPYISNLSLSLGVVLRDPDQEAEVVARVKVPKELLRRFLPLGDGSTFVSLEDVIAHNLGALFPGMEIVGHALFRVTRDTDYDVSDEAADLMQAVEDELRRRRFGEVVRLEVERDIDARLRGQLVAALGIEEDQVYEAEGMLGMDDLWDIAAVGGFDELRYPSFSGVTQPRLQAEDGKPGDVMGAMREGDILVHHP
jgi:polyphosphate kinase